MCAFLKRLWLAVLLLPLALHAEPVRVTTHYEGKVAVNQAAFPALGIDLSNTWGDVPYSITMSSLLDTSLPGADRLGVLEAFGQEVQLSITIAGQTFDYSGPTLRTYAGSNGRQYFHGVDIALGDERLWLYSLTGAGVVGDRITGLPLIPRDMATDTGAGIWTSFELSHSTSNSLMAGAEYSSLQVVSLVPEPAQGKLALAGLLALGLLGVRSRLKPATVRQDSLA